MKKFVKACLMFTVFAVLFSGCEDEITKSELTLDMSELGIIEVYFYADLPGDLGTKKAPEDTRVHVSVDYADYNPNTPAGRGRWATTALVDADGKIVVDNIPTHGGGVDVRVIPESFVEDGILYSTNPAEIFINDVFSGQTRTEDIGYEYQAAGNMIKTGDLETTFKYRADLNIDNQPVPSGINVLFSIDDPDLKWTYMGTTNASGIIELEVPALDGGVSLSINAEAFIATQIQTKADFSHEIETLFEVAAPTVITINAGQNHFSIIHYDVEDPIGDELPTVKRRFNFEVYYTQAQIDAEAIQQLGNQNIRIYNDNGEMFEDRNWGTDEEIELPKGQAVTLEFLGTFTTDDVPPEVKDTRYHLSLPAYTEDQPHVSIPEKKRFARQTL